MRKPTFLFLTWSDTNQAVQLQNMARSLKFLFQKVEGLYFTIYVAKIKALISFAVTDFASLFSHMQNVESIRSVTVCK